MIYFLRPKTEEPLQLNGRIQVEGRPIKIGSAVDPASRLAELVSLYKRADFAITGVMNGGMMTENILHRKFDHLRVKFISSAGARCKCEWFHPGRDLIDFIVEETKPLSVELSGDVTISIMTSDRFLMMVERAAMMKKMTISQFIESVTTDYFKDNYASAWPFRLF